MHELSICLSLLDQLQVIAQERNADRITRIELSVGPLSGVEADLLEHAYPLAAAGTLAEDAELVVGTANIVVLCQRWGEESGAATNRLVCGHCGDYRTSVVSGDELILQRVELEERPRRE